MLVYGDPSYAVVPSELADRIRQDAREHIAIMAAMPPGWQTAARVLDGLRRLLIQCGQLEQCVADTDEAFTAPSIPEATLEAASAFVAAWVATRHSWSHLQQAAPSVTQALRRLDATLPPATHLDRQTRVAKVPEGFAFYGLYPEQSCQATLRWINDHRDAADRSAMVVGVRSIGTTLSAVVAATLRMAGWSARRITVRPQGHPFDRQVHIDPAAAHGARLGVVVDEGPGISGSSMAATARALVEAGLSRACICFMPGHAGEPGRIPCEEVGEWWTQTPRYTTALDQVRWGGQTLAALLGDWSRSLAGRRERVAEIEDLGAGGWRRHTCEDPNTWPAVCTAFERGKYRVVTRCGHATLWKFAGLDLREMGPGECVRHGFCASPWIEGAALQREGQSPELLTQIGRHLARTAGDTLQPPELEAGWARLMEMAYVNTREWLGEAAADRARHRMRQVTPQLVSYPSRACANAGLAPHDWLRSVSGRIVPAPTKHRWPDHTVVGRQPWTWDVAGVIVEWELDADGVSVLLDGLGRAGGEPLPSLDLLTAFETAYAAFRLGQCMLCADAHERDPAERRRLRRAADGYGRQLAALAHGRTSSAVLLTQSTHGP